MISGFRAARGRRAGSWSACAPDLTCLGKIIGGGLPVGAYGGRADLMALVSPAGPGLSGGHAVGEPAGDDRRHLVPRPADAEAVRSARARSARGWPAGLADAARDAGVALQVNAFGSLLTPFFTDRPVRDYASATSANTEQYATFFRGMLARGIYPPPSQFEAWFLSAAHTARDVDMTDDGCLAVRWATCRKSEVRRPSVETSGLRSLQVRPAYRQGIRRSIQLIRVRSL